MKDERRMKKSGDKNKEREESGIGPMSSRLLVMRRKMEGGGQILMLMGNPRDRNMPCRGCMENTLAELPAATVGSEVKAGKKRLETERRALSSPDHLRQPWTHQREGKKGLRKREGGKRKE